MSPLAAVEPPLDTAFLAAAEQRAQRVALLLGERPGSWYRALIPLRESAADVPALIKVARAGVLAQKLIEQHDGWARRLELVRQLHEPRGPRRRPARLPGVHAPVRDRAVAVPNNAAARRHA